MPRFEKNDVTRGLIALALAAAPIACSLVTSLDGLAGSPSGDDGGASDAATPHPDGASGGHDGASGGDGAPGDDAGTPPDDASDAGLLADGEAGTWCTTQPASLLFCDDFDQGALATPWDQVSSKNGAAVLSGGLFTSSPFAMLVSTVGGSQVVDCAGYKTFAKLTSGAKVLTLSFDIRVVLVDTTTKSDAVLGAIQLFDAFNDTWDLQLEGYYDPSSGALSIDFSEDGNPGDGGANKYQSHPASQQLPVGVWTRVTMELTMQTPLVPFGPASARLLFDGTVVAAPGALSIETIAPTPEILVGATYVGPGNAGWAVGYDDVTFAQQ